MITCCVKNVEIGTGKPKICIPIVGKTDLEILEQARSLKKYHYDLVELRIDHYENALNSKAVRVLLKKLRRILKCPILFTCRTLNDGGELDLEEEKYSLLLMNAILSESIDLLDVEFINNNFLLYKLIEIAHQHDVKVIMSNHDFHETPETSVIVDRLEKMEVLGADILKMAYMPLSKRDVVRLLDLTITMSEKFNKPIVSMSMGEMGKISRICGELSGSAITFAYAGKASAPGQINVKDMEVLLETIHHD